MKEKPFDMILKLKTCVPLKYIQPTWDGVLLFGDKDIVFELGYGHIFKSKFNTYVRHFSKNINVISEAFHNASEKASDKLLGLVRDIADSDIDDFGVNGVFVAANYVHMLRHYFRKGSQDVCVAYFCFHISGAPVAIYIDDIFKEKGQFGWVSSVVADIFSLSSNKDIFSFLHANIGRVIIYEMFKRFASVETSIIKPGGKANHSGQRIKNELPFSVTFLTSTWFTNIVRNEGFKVRGHFRLQPCGEGLKDRKIVWIEEFEKHGYSRRAQINVNKDK